MAGTLSNREMACTFLQLASSGKVDEAYDRFAAAGFRHHNPYYAGDAASLKAGMKQNAADFPNKIFEIQRSIQDGDLVAVHSKARPTPSALGAVVVHIFRFQNSKIAELWDIGQPIPESTINENGIL